MAAVDTQLDVSDPNVAVAASGTPLKRKRTSKKDDPKTTSEHLSRDAKCPPVDLKQVDKEATRMPSERVYMNNYSARGDSTEEKRVTRKSKSVKENSTRTADVNKSSPTTSSTEIQETVTSSTGHVESKATPRATSVSANQEKQDEYDESDEDSVEEDEDPEEMKDFIVEDKSDDSDGEETPSESGPDPLAIDRKNELPAGTKRTRRPPQRYVEEVMGSTEYRKMILDDVPEDEVQAALQDEDFSECEEDEVCSDEDEDYTCDEEDEDDDDDDDDEDDYVEEESLKGLSSTKVSSAPEALSSRRKK